MRACADNLSRWPVLCCSICAALVLSVLFCPGAGARVKGPCNSCHTMHNSQGGQPMAKDDNGNPINTPYEALLISSCLGCHSSSTSQTIVTTSWGETPIVNNLIAPVNPLAGGNFYYSSGSYTYTNGHYSVGDTGHNLTASTLPYGGGFINSTAPNAYNGPLRCSGTHGCHGYNGGHGEAPDNSYIDAIKGGHHGKTSPMDGSTVARSYRMLYGITGVEDPNWEQANSNTAHNQYQGGTSSTQNNTISYLCAECHGNFHSSTGTGGSDPWIRHPTDIVLPASGEYASYTVYNMNAPVARQNPSTASETVVTPGSDVIMCLTCHRAHASPWYKGLRWDFANSSLTTAISGCNVCHTSKN